MIKEFKNEISIIVPVFNAQGYLGECIESILAQNMSDFELILVNDGSTDASLSICEKYAAIDTRIRIIQTNIPHSGPSVARNIGIEASYGKYIMFVDADDIVAKSTLKFMHAGALKNGSQLVICDSFVFDETIENYDVNEINKSQVHVIDFTEILRLLFGDNPHGAPWGKLYSRTFIDDTLFLANIMVGEDYLFNIDLLKKNMEMSATYLAIPLYLYRINDNGQRFLKQDTTPIARKFSLFIEQIDSMYPSASKYVKYRLAIFFLSSANSLQQKVKSELTQISKNAKWTKNNLKDILDVDKRFIKKVQIWMFANFPKTYIRLIHYLIK